MRRAELLPAYAKGTNDWNKALFQGKQTLHFSLHVHPEKPLNYSHDYRLFFLQTADFSADTVYIATGTPMGQNIAENKRKNLRFYGNSRTNDKILFETEFSFGWHNFALYLDFGANTVQVYYSKGDDVPLPVTGTIQNSFAGTSIAHFGILKRPTGNTGLNYLYQGYQAKGVTEAIVYGGIFEENGLLDCSIVNTGVGKRRRGV